MLKQLIEPRACPTEDLEHLLRGVLRRCGLQEEGARSLGGVDALAAILEETGSQGRPLKDALVSGTENGPNAARQLESTLLLSASLVDMDPQDIIEMLGKVDASDVLVFLSAASPQVVETILQALPTRRREQLQEDLQEQLASGALPPSSRAALQQTRRRVLQAAAKV